MTTPWIQGNSGEWQQMGGPRIVEPQDPGEMAEAQLQAQMRQVGLSPTEQAYLRQLQYGRQSIQRQVDAGQIRPQTAMSMLGQIDERAIPLRVRASQMPIIQRRLQILQLQRNMAQREAMIQQNAQFRARSLQDRITTVNGVAFMETQPGQFEPLPVGLQEGRGPTVRPEMNPTQLLEIANRFRREYRDQNNGTEPSQEAIQAHVNSQMDLLGGLMGRPPSTSLTARGAATGATGTSVPATGATPPSGAPGASPTQPQPSPGVDMTTSRAERMRTIAGLDEAERALAPARGVMTNEGARHREMLLAGIREAREILGAPRDGEAIPAGRRARFNEIMAQIQELTTGRRPRNAGPAVDIPDPLITPPQAPPPARTPRVGERGPAFGQVPRF